MKKDIELLIRTLHQEVLFLDRTPTEIILKPEHWNELMEKYKDQKKQANYFKYIQTRDSIRQSEEELNINKYLGLPIREGKFTEVKFK